MGLHSIAIEALEPAQFPQLPLGPIHADLIRPHQGPLAIGALAGQEARIQSGMLRIGRNRDQVRRAAIEER
jgi:hypothetical protein